MGQPLSWRLTASCLLALTLSSAARAADDDLDALDLKSAPPADAVAESGLRVALELAAGRIEQRGGLSSRNGRRASIDLRYTQRLSESWRFTLSDRLDETHPSLAGQRTTSNSLREAYVTWQEEGAAVAADVGRLNWRQGPAYGYNPTDYFRTNALRTITTLDPVTLREMRMGTVMLRLGSLWSSGGVTLALAPKLEDRPTQSPASLDLGATNSSNRAVLVASQRFSERYSAQGSLLLERGKSPTVGASMTALPTDAVVAYAEWSYGEKPDLLRAALAAPDPGIKRHQASLGLTYTLPGALALTLEAEYNGAGLNRVGWDQLVAQGPAAYQRYQAVIQPSQELGSRRAWLVYASQKSIGLKDLDFAGFVRINAVDHSRLVWGELRYHWQRFDAAIQWQRSGGGAGTEFGVMPYRQAIQLVGVFYM